MEEQVEQVESQSSILNDEEVQLLFAEEGNEEEEVVLPSEEAKDEYANLSREELIEKLKSNTPPVEEVPTEVVPTTVVDEFTTKYNENGGKFTEEDYKNLEAKGFNKDFVDTYVQGQKAKETAALENIIKPYGSLQDYADATVYAQNSWTKEQIDAYNTAIAKADNNTAQVLISSLMKEYKSSNNKPATNGPITNTTQPKPKTMTGYDTKSEMTRDMNDPRYGKDPSYTSKVEEKLLMTDMNSWYAGVYKGD